ncbi:hypothetical protein AAHA92_20659 [Salvia divinorum]|uniref:Uncharacterized protein n=1 Tax=Salvia divinorum TaxID=28513 RepID=A0ABD1GHV9_SALDI
MHHGEDEQEEKNSGKICKEGRLNVEYEQIRRAVLRVRGKATRQSRGNDERIRVVPTHYHAAVSPPVPPSPSLVFALHIGLLKKGDHKFFNS